MRLSVIAGVAGVATQAAVQLGAIRALDDTIGKEAVARFGLGLTLTAVSRLFELGIPASALRAIAKSPLSSNTDAAVSSDQVLLSSERAYLRIAPFLLLAMLSLILWLLGGDPSTNILEEGALLLGGLLAFICAQWPTPLFESVLAATGRIPLSQFVGICARLLSYGAGIVGLYAGGSEAAFYFLLTLGACAHAVTLRHAAKSATRSQGKRSANDAKTWSPVAGFSTSVTTITILSTALANLDKLTVARALTLAEYSGYALAALAAGSLQIIALPILNVGVPSLTNTLHTPTAHERLIRTLSRLNATLVVIVASLLAVYAPLILHVWLGRSADAQTILTMRIFVLGSVLNTFVNVAHALQLAHGRLEIGIRTHLILLVAYLPCAFAMALHFGAVGAAQAWLLMNVAYVLLALPWTLRSTRQGFLLAALFGDIAKATIAPALVVAAVVVWGRLPMIPSIMAGLHFFITTLAILTLSVGFSRDLRSATSRWMSAASSVPPR